MIKSKKLVSQIERPAPETLKRGNLYRFEKNERTTLFTQDQFNKIISTLTPFDLVAYGELEPFYESVCKWLNVNRNELLLTAGSDLGIKAVFETFINEGDTIINFLPNYAMFSVYAKMFGAKENVKYYNDNIEIDFKDLLASVSSETRLVVISNPGHNGISVSEENLIKLLDYTKNTQTIILVDEAYVDFGEVDMLRHINTYNNLLIVRTMSKAFGIASVRIGFLLSCEGIIRELYRVKPVHEIDGVAAKVGKYLVENIHIKEKFVQDVKEGKRFLVSRFRSMGIDILPSDTNFVYFKLNRAIDPVTVVNDLVKKGIYIKSPLGVAPFNGYLRTTVGDVEQMKYFCDALEETLNTVA